MILSEKKVKEMLNKIRIKIIEKKELDKDEIKLVSTLITYTLMDLESKK